MSRVLERERARIPVRRRSPILDYTLIAIGALAALAGLYFQFAPSDWLLAHFSEMYQYGGYTLGGLLLGAGFGVRRLGRRGGRPRVRTVGGGRHTRHAWRGRRRRRGAVLGALTGARLEGGIMKRSRAALLALVVAAGGLALAACAPGANDIAEAGAGNLAGFWLGLWHGIIAPVTFLISLFNDNVNIYEVHNNGNWYNFGFMFGLSVVFGSGSRASAPARRSARSPRTDA
jgi:hypothetical protein